MMYWIVFAIFTTAEIFIDTIVGFWYVCNYCIFSGGGGVEVHTD